LKNCNRFR